MAAIATPLAHVHLSKTKRAHPREGDAEDTIIIRDANESLNSRFRTFGVKGRENLENVYFGLIGMLAANRDTIINISQYKQVRMKQFLKEINNVDRQKIKDIIVKPDMETIRMGEVELRSVLTDSYPRLGLSLYDKNDCRITEMHLFVPEVVSLLKWMNQYYGIGDTRFVVYEITDKYDFF